MTNSAQSASAFSNHVVFVGANTKVGFTGRPGADYLRSPFSLWTGALAPGVEVNDRSIDLAVSRLRAKLGDTAREPSLIRTLRGEGYLFDAEVSPC